MISKDPEQFKTVVNGLVLAGGKSNRMGQDKGLIEWYGKEHRYYMADMLQKFCASVFISCRKEQEQEIHNRNYKTISDACQNAGSYGAILSAFNKSPDAAWLVVACDLPLVDEATIEYLLQNRKPSMVATTFKSPYDNLPEPLITVWEPCSLAVLLSFLSAGITCPRKALLNSQVHIIQPPHPEKLVNVNTPVEAEKVRAMLFKPPQQ